MSGTPSTRSLPRLLTTVAVLLALSWPAGGLVALDAAIALPQPLHAIAVDPATPTRRDYDQARRAAYLAYRSALYRQHAGGAAYDEQALAYLAAWARAMTNAPPLPGQADLAASARALVGVGCRDPLVGYFIALQLHDIGEVPAAVARLTECLAQFRAGAYPAAFPYLCLKRLVAFSAAGAARGADGRNATVVPAGLLAEFKQATRLLLATREDGYFPEARDAYASLADTIGASRLHAEAPFDGIIEVVLEATAPGAQDWLALTLRGACYLEKAWHVRGGATVVAPADWPAVRQLLASARTALEAAWQLDRTRPEPAELMIQVCMCGISGPREQRYWFDQALSAERDCPGAFRNLFIAWTPRWGGSLAMVEALGEAALATRDFASLLPDRYLEAMAVVRDAAERAPDPAGLQAVRLHANSEAVFARTREVFDGYLAAKPDADVEPGYTVFRYAFIVGQDLGRPAPALEILRRNGMDWIRGSRDRIRGLTPLNLYDDLQYQLKK